MRDICINKGIFFGITHMESLHLGEFIKGIISNKNLTQSEVAEKMSMSRNGLHSTLNKENMNTDLIRRFSSVLGINLWEKIYFQTIPHGEERDYHLLNEPRPIYTTKEEAEAITISFKVSLDKKNEILQILQK